MASNPPISGICTSISTTSNDCRCIASTASRPLPAITTLCPRRSSRLAASRWLTALSSASSTVQPPLRQIGGQHRRRQRRALAGLLREHSRDRRQQLALFDRLGQMRRDPDLAALPRLVELARRAQHHDRRAQLRLVADPPRDLEAVHLRHVRVEQDQRERPAPIARLDQRAASPRRRSRPRSGFMCQRSSRSCSTRRFTPLSSTISTGRSVRLTAGGVRPRVGEAEAHGEMERAAFVRRALQPDPAAHQVDERRRRSPGPGRCRRSGASSSRRPAGTARRSRAACRPACRCRCR